MHARAPHSTIAPGLSDVLLLLLLFILREKIIINSERTNERTKGEREGKEKVTVGQVEARRVELSRSSASAVG